MQTHIQTRCERLPVGGGVVINEAMRAEGRGAIRPAFVAGRGGIVSAFGVLKGVVFWNAIRVLVLLLLLGSAEATFGQSQGVVVMSGGSIFGPEPNDPTLALRGNKAIYTGDPLGRSVVAVIPFNTVELWIGPRGSSECDLVLVPGSQTAVVNGVMQGKQALTIPGSFVGQIVVCQLRAYDARKAASWAIASDAINNILHGSSALFQITLGSPSLPLQLKGFWENFNIHTDNVGTVVGADWLAVSSFNDSSSGFLTRIHQMPRSRFPGDVNSVINAERQLALDFRDPETLAVYPNVADLSAALPDAGEGPGFFARATVNWGLVDYPGLENFPSNQTIPGVPAGTGVADNIAAEIRGIVFLSQGSHRWVVNSDDGFRLTLGRGRGDVFGLVLGQFDGGRGPSDSIVDFYVEKSGFYHMRCDWWQGVGAAAVEIASVDPCTGQRILLNDRTNPRAVRVYSEGVGPAFCRSVAPVAGQTDVDVRSPITILLVDDAVKIDVGSLSVSVNQVAQTFKRSRVGTVTSLVVDPPKGGWTPLTTYFVFFTYNGTQQQYSFTTTMLPTGTFFVEAEDFNFKSGRSNPKVGVAGLDVNRMPYFGGAYDGLSADALIDYQFPTIVTDGDVYRLGEKPNNPMVANQDFNQGFRGSFFTQNSYRLGWVSEGEWMNYTRTLPPAKYSVLAALSHISLDPGANRGFLLQVTTPPTQQAQTTQFLGTFDAAGNGAWGINVLVPLMDGKGNFVTVAGNNQPMTIRYMGLSGDVDYLAFVPQGNNVPSISDIPDQVTDEDKATPAIAFTISDPDQTSDTLTVVGASSNTDLVAPSGLVFGGAGGNRTLTITPLPNQFGTTVITVWVVDQVGARMPEQFVLTVKPVNDPPSLGIIQQQSVDEDTTSAEIALSPADPETPLSQLVLTAKAQDPTLIPDGNIAVGFANGVWSMHFTPAPDRFGTTTMTVTVTDGGGLVASRVFTVRVIGINDPPVISQINSVSVQEGDTTAPIPFTVGDKETSAVSLTLSATSSNLGLIPLSSIIFGGSGSNRTVQIKAPAVGVGVVGLTVSVSDGQFTIPTEFRVIITPAPRFDYGDAPDTYGTTKKNNGAVHRILDGFFLGNLVDSELDGQPDALSQGDDLAGTDGVDDEDGVRFASVLIRGLNTTVSVTAPQFGFLDAWMDFNQDGDFLDQGERVLTRIPMRGGITNLSWVIPLNSAIGKTFVRFRLTREGIDQPIGPAPDGEVEDYAVEVYPLLFDFGDAPELGTDYPTTLSRTGAVHIYLPVGAGGSTVGSLTHVSQVPPRLFLGRLIDPEPDGQPSPDAKGDDNTPNQPDDEDGIRFLTPLVPGTTAMIEVISSATGKLDGWIDWGRDGSWKEGGDRIFDGSMTVTGGVNRLEFPVPSTAVAGASFARFRLSPTGNLNYFGATVYGEVEDYQVTISKPSRCDYSCSGRSFLITFPGNYTPDPANPSQLSLCIASRPETLCLVVIPSLRFTNVINFGGSRLMKVDLPKEAELGSLNDGITNKGIFIVATADISVVGINSATNTTDGFRALPIDVLGTEYLVQAYRNVNAGKPRLNGSQFAIVGIESNTVVTITPSVRVGARDPGVPFNITLQPGDTYQLRNTNDVPGDLSGTQIRATAPIGVYGSHRCANINGPSTFFCDHLVEQLMPVRDFSTTIPVYRLQGRNGGDTYRIIAARDNTHVSINGSLVATLNRGQTHEQIIAGGAVITADLPVGVTQFANSSDYDGIENADPFMANVIPSALYAINHDLCTGPERFVDHFINIIVPLDARTSTFLDGVVIPAGDFQQLGTSSFYGVSKRVSFGYHNVNSKLPVGVMVYGWAQYDSYGWPGCINFGDITPPVIIPPGDVKVKVGDPSFTTGGGVNPGCAWVLPDLRNFLGVTDACVSSKLITLRQDPPAGTLLPPGDHTITFTGTDPRGNVGTATMVITVLPDDGPPTIVCPDKQIVVPCEDSTGATVVFKAYAKRICGEELPVICTPPSGSRFPVGRTLVTCRTDDPVAPQSCEFVVEVQCGQTHTIDAVVTPGGIRLTWSAAIRGTLQSAPTPLGPWKAVTGALSPFDVKKSEKAQFFRFVPAL